MLSPEAALSSAEAEHNLIFPAAEGRKNGNSRKKPMSWRKKAVSDSLPRR
jgi:hypothetical protein